MRFHHFVLLMMALCGCATVGNLQSSNPKLYGGLQIDREALSKSISHPEAAFMRTAGVFGVVDAPFSLIADTVTLPIVLNRRHHDDVQEALPTGTVLPNRR